MASRAQIAVTFKGKKYTGEYEIAGRLIRVFFDGQSRVALMKGCDAELLARIIFIELVSEAELLKATQRGRDRGNAAGAG
jgi:hypothetical protein